MRQSFVWVFLVLACQPLCGHAEEKEPSRQYFAHPAVEDRYGVIAPWYTGQNGQCDFRIRVAAETLKRYPWASPEQAVVPAPHFVFSGGWSIKPDGTITPSMGLPDWANGDVGQRSASLLLGMSDYYRYTSDPAAIGIVAMTADYVLDYCQTPADHPWPGFFISAPTKGKAYGQADPHGFIQLDLTARVGTGMVAAYHLTGNARYWEAAKHWADLFAAHCDLRGGVAPWGRYANPEDTPWKEISAQTAGVVLILEFLDTVIRSGYTGEANALVKAREAGEKHLRDVLLPQWTRNPTFGHHFWDWTNETATCSLPCFVSQYLIDHREAFPNWKSDVRNILSLLFCRLGVDPASAGGVYSGTWAIPEAYNCCGKSLQYPTAILASAMAQYGVTTGDAWAREIARRESILATYDAHETGVVEDLIDGGAFVAVDWFNLAHPWPLKCAMDMLAWQPELVGANRENHIVRTTSVVQEVHYDKGNVSYRVKNSSIPNQGVLRLAFTPKSVTADGASLPLRETLTENGYTVKPLGNGDCIVTIRHDGCGHVRVEGDDPQESAEEDRLQYEGNWTPQESPDSSGGTLHVADAAGASAQFEFTGNQVRLLGRADPNGGKADVYLDGVKQLCGIDFWCPQPRDRQVLCYKNGLVQGKHTLKVVALGTKNARAAGTRAYIDAVQWSAAQGNVGIGEGDGPSDPQRMIFGYTGDKDYADSQGHAWRPATEFVMRLHFMADLVPISFWSEPRVKTVANTDDSELYRYGVHGRDFTAYFTVNPQATYYARIKLCQSDAPPVPGQYATTIDIQGNRAATDVDVAATAGGLGKAVDLVFNNIQPQNGVIAIRFWNRFFGEAMVQAIEIGPGESSPGATPVSFPFPTDTNHVTNPGFEAGVVGSWGAQGGLAVGNGWYYRFVGENQSYVYQESHFAPHPEFGLPKPHGGKEALRTYALEHDGHTLVYQDIPVAPRSTYRASVWVQGVDVRGKGFGQKSTDSASLCIEERDANDHVLVKHPTEAVTKPCDFVELTKTFTTSEKTTMVRFLLETVIGCKADEGHVTYDDCALVSEDKADGKP